MPSENNKRIFKNTLLLYFRMLLIMAVSLYTVRVVLKTLGVVDYGINNVVGGIVTMFSFLSSTMAGASERFFAFDLGRNDHIQLKRTFSLTFTIYGVIALIVLLLAETIGLWFLNTKMVIPADRVSAANWVYQFAVLSFIVTIMTIPYNSAIIARENMNVFAYVSIVEALLKLAIVYLLVFFSYDKLKLYAILLFITTCITTFIYRAVCKRKYKECRFSFYWDKTLFKTLLSYSGWNLFGAVAGIFNNQAINILLNIFFGPAVNAARGIAFQINISANNFVRNFQLAVNPQIIKSFAISEKEYLHELILRGTKFSCFLFLFISIPIFFETSIILRLWLKLFPPQAIIFLKLIILIALVDCFSVSIGTAIVATGNIKKYQIIVGSLQLLIIVFSYLFMLYGSPPEVAFYINLLIAVIAFILRLVIVAPLIGLSKLVFLKKAIFPSILVSFIAASPVSLIISAMEESVLRLIIVVIVSSTSICLSTYFIGLNKNEKNFIRNIVIKNIKMVKW